MNNLTDQQKKCGECKECCEYLEVPTTMLAPEVLDWWLIRGEQFYIDPQSGVFNMRFYKPCQYLTETGCSIYENRPKVCREYMCAYGDKSVKAAKEALCAETMAHVNSVTERWREDEHTKDALKNWKEKGNDLQPSKPDENAGISGDNPAI